MCLHDLLFDAVLTVKVFIQLFMWLIASYVCWAFKLLPGFTGLFFCYVFSRFGSV